MNRNSIALLFPLYLTGVACGDDGSTSDTVEVDASPTNEVSEETTTNETSGSASSSDDSTTKREGPWGCYLQDHHACDCSIESESECEGVGLWTEGCASCAPSTETPTETTNTADGGIPAETSEVEDGGTDLDAAASPDQSDASANFGCYNPTQHTCACDTTEATCLADDGIWTAECECAPQVDPTTSDGDNTAPVTTSEVPNDTTSRVDTSEPTVTSTVDTSPDAAAPGKWACYLPTNHTCDCVMNESECGTAEGIWTDSCDSCFLADAGP